MLEGVNDAPRRRSGWPAPARDQGQGEPDPLQRLGGLELRRPPLPRILAFQAILLDAGITTTVRWSKGEDIGAACGQLKEAVLA